MTIRSTDISGPMLPLSKGRRFEHGLSFLATLAFLGGFFGARLFHLAFPSLMVITQGIHFHHFWYGLAMRGLAGWFGTRGQRRKFRSALCCRLRRRGAGRR